MIAHDHRPRQLSLAHVTTPPIAITQHLPQHEVRKLRFTLDNPMRIPKAQNRVDPVRPTTK